MIVDISIAVTAAAFVALVIFLIMTLQTTRQTLRQTNKTLHDVQKNLEGLSQASMELIEDIDDLTNDIKKKSEALNVVFRPLSSFNKEKSESRHESKHESKGHDKLSEVLDSLAQGIVIFNKIREEVKSYVKSR